MNEGSHSTCGSIKGLNFIRICIAMVLCGSSAFAALYFVQPLLPIFVTEFGINPAEAGLAMSLPTGALVFGLFFIGPLSDALGRRGLILISTVATACLLAVMAISDDWTTFLICRTLLGLTLGGVTAINLTYLSEELPPTKASRAIGFVLAGNSIGGMVARLVVGSMAEHTGWRAPVFCMSVLTLLAAGLVLLWIPKSVKFTPAESGIKSTLSGYAGHLSAPGMGKFFLQGFLLMGCFVAFFNLLGFYLLLPELAFSQVAIGMVSIVFLPSTFAALKAARCTEIFGARRTAIASILLACCGALMTLLPWVPAIIFGTLCFAVGFFGAHSVATSEVGRRALTQRGKATALYQISFYSGASLASVVAGLLWQFGGWSLVVASIVAALACAAASWLQSAVGPNGV